MTRKEYLNELENVVQNCDFTARFSSGIDIKIYTDMLEEQIQGLQNLLDLKQQEISVLESKR